LNDNWFCCQIFTIRGVGHGEFAQLAGCARLTELPMNGETFVTGARGTSAGSDFEPIVGTRVTKDATAEAAMMATDENGETRLTALTIADGSIGQPLICRLNPLQV
jgi:hypothetical protein